MYTEFLRLVSYFPYIFYSGAAIKSSWLSATSTDLPSSVEVNGVGLRDVSLPSLGTLVVGPFDRSKGYTKELRRRDDISVVFLR
jgi:hypothetical protein